MIKSGRVYERNQLCACGPYFDRFRMSGCKPLGAGSRCRRNSFQERIPTDLVYSASLISACKKFFLHFEYVEWGMSAFDAFEAIISLHSKPPHGNGIS